MIDPSRLEVRIDDDRQIPLRKHTKEKNGKLTHQIMHTRMSPECQMYMHTYVTYTAHASTSEICATSRPTMLMTLMIMNVVDRDW